MIRSHLLSLVLLLLIFSCSKNSKDPAASCPTKYLTKVNYTPQIYSPVVETFLYNDQKLASKYLTTDIAWYNLSFTYQDKLLTKVDMEISGVVNFTYYLNYNTNNTIEYIIRKNPALKALDSIVFSHDNSGHVTKRGRYVISSISNKLELFSLETYEYAGENVSTIHYTDYFGGNVNLIRTNNFQFDNHIKPYAMEYDTFLAYIGMSQFSINNLTKSETVDDKGNKVADTYDYTYDNENYVTQQIIRRDNKDMLSTTTFTYSCEPPLK